MEACQALSDRFTDIEKKRSDLAVYLCEDPNQLSLEELFGTIGTFRELFIKSLKVRTDSLMMLVILKKVFLLCKMGLLFLSNEFHTGEKNRNQKRLKCLCPNDTKTNCNVRSALGLE